MVPQYQEYCTKIITKLFLLTLAFVGGWLITESILLLPGFKPQVIQPVS